MLNLHSESDRISLVLGSAGSVGAGLPATLYSTGGTSADINLYSEGAYKQLWIVTNVQNSNSQIRFVTDDVFDEDLTKIEKLGPLFAGADYAAYQKLDGYTFLYSTGDVFFNGGNNSEMLNESAPTIECGPHKSRRTLNQDTAKFFGAAMTVGLSARRCWVLESI